MPTKLIDVLAKPWKQHPESADSIVCEFTDDASTPYAITVTHEILIPQMIALQNAAHKGYIVQQKALASNAKLIEELSKQQAKLDELQAKLNAAEARAAEIATDSIANLFTY